MAYKPPLLNMFLVRTSLILCRECAACDATVACNPTSSCLLVSEWVESSQSYGSIIFEFIFTAIHNIDILQLILYISYMILCSRLVYALWLSIKS